ATVVALDVDPAKLESASGAGASLALDVRATDAKAVKKAIRDHAKARGAPETRWRIFECSGTPAGQEAAWNLLVHGAFLSVVGFTKETVALRLSNLMAFDATARGNWGCDPALYPRVLELALSGAVRVAPNVELRPLASIDQAFREVHAGKLRRRIVLVPDPKELA
ncbi:MAG: zinc-binding dehydrogenase, partial [Burkholderiaceae bacterium]|nr:zinc-binding dehydrogenase [Burkholderiaceae bacterium]